MGSNQIFENHIYGTENYIPTLKKALEIVGLQLKDKINPNICAQYFGIVAVKENGKYIIKKIEPNSIADRKWNCPEDEILKIDQIAVDDDLNDFKRL